MKIAVRWLVALFLCSGLTGLSVPSYGAEAPSAGPDPQLASPRDTMHTFLVAILRAMERGDEDAWSRAIACFEVSQTDAQRGRAIAENIKEALDRLERIDWRTTPLPDAVMVQAKNLTAYTYFPDPRFKRRLGTIQPKGRIELVRNEAGLWKFSAQTARESHLLYRSLEGLDYVEGVVTASQRSWRLWLHKQMPRSLKGPRHELLTLEYWQWLGLFLVILGGVVVDYTVRFILRIFTARFMSRHGAGDHADTTRRMVRPVGLLVAAMVWMIFLPVLGLAGIALTVLLGAARVFAILACTWAAWRMTDLVGEVLIEKAARTQTRFDDVLVPLVRKTVKIFIIAMGLIYGASSLRIEIMPLLASLGIGGVAFAFAAKDTVENFFGSMAVLIDRPFEVGDWVVIDKYEGTVEEVGFRSTRIRTFYNSLITMPNSNLVRAVVDNYGRRRYRRWKTYVGVQYDTPPDKLIAFTEGIRELVRCHPYTRKDYFQVYLNQFGSSSLDILLYVFHEVPDWSTELRERERLFIDIVRLADQLGVQFAFPTQTIHLYQEEHQTQPHTPAHAPSSGDDHNAAIGGIRSAQHLVHSQSWQKQKPDPVQFHSGPTHLSDTHES